MLRWRGRGLECVEQVANGPDDGIDLTPASEAPALAVKAAWEPVLSGQAVPKLGERGYAEPDDGC